MVDHRNRLDFLKPVSISDVRKSFVNAGHVASVPPKSASRQKTASLPTQGNSGRVLKVPASDKAQQSIQRHTGQCENTGDIRR
jgi:hypothetical protein